MFTKYLAGSCSPAEWEELLVLIGAMDENDAETLTGPLHQLWLKAGNKEANTQSPFFEREKLYSSIVAKREAEATPVRRIKWWHIAVAAVFIGIVITAGLVVLKDNPAATPVASKPDATSPDKIRPGTDKAVLTLANGQQIILDSTATGAITKQGNTTILNFNGKLTYEGSKKTSAGSELTYNTVTTANANQYQLILGDGSKVWLNAASSIRFPTEFIGDRRTVEITGEAYFEVTHDQMKPFHVKVNGADIEVLGTHFNVNAYSDEATIKASLLEGAVRITAKGKSDELAPGQEANISPAGGLAVLPGNVEMSVAWVKGYFQFDQAPLPVIMRQIGRWYDLDIKYERGIVPDRIFKGKIQRSLPLSGILNLLRKGDIEFRVEGKALVITG